MTTQTEEASIWDAILYVIKHLEPERDSWIVIKREQFLAVLNNILKRAHDVPQRVDVNEFRIRLKQPRQRFVEYPVAIKTDKCTYALIPYLKLEKYAESGKVKFAKYNTCSLLTMWFS